MVVFIRYVLLVCSLNVSRAHLERSQNNFSNKIFNRFLLKSKIFSRSHAKPKFLVINNGSECQSNSLVSSSEVWSALETFDNHLHIDTGLGSKGPIIINFD